MRYRLLLLLLLFLLPPCAQAKEVSAAKIMADFPVLHEGRIKPFDTAARNMLDFLSGRNMIDGKSATQWLTHAIFSPAYAVTTPVIRLDTRREVDLLNLPPSQHRIYSAEDITLARLAAAAQGHDIPLSEDLETRLALIHQISHTLTPFLPLTYDDFAGKNLLDVLRDNDGSLDNPVISSVMMQGQNNILLRLIPHPGLADRMMTPWQVLAGVIPGPSIQASFDLWQQAAQNWQDGRLTPWAEHMKQLKALSIDSLSLSTTKLRLERHLNTLQPLLLIMLASLLGLAAYILLWVGLRLPASLIRRSSLLVMAVCFTLTLVKMAGRILILERPPVGTLYESILFVLLIVFGYGLYKLLRRNTPAILAAGILTLGVALSVLARVHEGDADNMMMLGAVLNSHFWLIVHVLVITAGYAVCLLCSMVAYLILFKPVARGQLIQDHPLYPVMIRSALAALALTATGTVLGGIWADQSWGRFWGWDPKENGALLIVIWLAWVLHARLGGFLQGAWVAGGFAFTVICVALSWFGVNLLGVGLHSYGFTEGAFTGLMGFIILNITAIILLVYRWRHQTAPCPQG